VTSMLALDHVGQRNVVLLAPSRDTNLGALHGGYAVLHANRSNGVGKHLFSDRQAAAAETAPMSGIRVTAKDLAYVRRRYISSVDMLRRAIAIVADGTLRARNPAIWGTCTPKNWAARLTKG
jgi:hypothetical protein